MDYSSSDAVLRGHLDRNPEAQRAALHDPQYAAEVHRLRLMLGYLDEALAAEGLSDKARHRVGSRLVAGCLGTDETNARARSVQELLTRDVATAPASW
ncbi:hypothetical protein [Streptomyces smyrnaeus]|uniref:hypothetical protein n=1 Tax=Streptomyces smyrnaeus TaxID=1387713 RepID=UPI0036AE5861